MATTNENTSAYSGSGSASDKTAGQTITADTFNQMINVLETLASHNHIFYDDYTTVCECQCQCACSRGTL